MSRVAHESRTRVSWRSLQTVVHAVPQRDFAAPPLSLVRAIVCSLGQRAILKPMDRVFDLALLHLPSGLRTALEEAGLDGASTLANQTTREPHCQSCRHAGMVWTMLMSGMAYLRRVLTWLLVVWYYALASRSVVFFYGAYLFRLSFLAVVLFPPVVSLVTVFAHASNHRACRSYGHEQVWGNLRSNQTENVRRRLRRTEELVCWTETTEVVRKFRRIRGLEVLVCEICPINRSSAVQ